MAIEKSRNLAYGAAAVAISPWVEVVNGVQWQKRQMRRDTSACRVLHK